MSAEALVALSGIVLSLVFSFLPTVKDWYAARTGDEKRAVMAGLLLVVAGAVFGLSCAGIGVNPLGSPIVFDDPAQAATCNKAGVLDLIGQYILALTLAGAANQAMYRLTPRGQGDNDAGV